MSQSNVLANINKQTLLSQLGFDINDLSRMSENKNKFFYEKRIIKNNKSRNCHVATKNLRIFHQNLSLYISKRIKFPQYVQGSIKGKSNGTNAKLHLGANYICSFDISNFFPSVTDNMVELMFNRLGLNKELQPLFVNLCTVNNRLPQGFSCSSIIANLVVQPIDAVFDEYCKKHSLVYSRSVDDLTVSSEKELFPHFGFFKSNLSKHGFNLAEKKTSFADKSKPQVVTKLVVNDKIRPQKSYLKKLKKDIRLSWDEGGVKELIEEYKLPPQKIYKKLLGRISYVKNLDKHLGHRIRALLVRSKLKSK